MYELYPVTTNGTIFSLLQRVPHFFEGCYAYVTALDSASNIVGSLEYIQRVGFPALAAGRAIIIPPEYVASFIASTLAPTFDEFFLVPIGQFRPARVDWEEIYTSDICEVGVEVPESLVLHMQTLGATRFVSDGLTLNAICDSAALREEVLQAFARGYES